MIKSFILKGVLPGLKKKSGSILFSNDLQKKKGCLHFFLALMKPEKKTKSLFFS